MTLPSRISNRVSHIAIREWAALGYLYETGDDSPASDEEFDELAQWITTNYSWLKPVDLNGYLPEDPAARKSAMGLGTKVVGQTRDYALSIEK
jgi:hypothetical protein